MAVQFDGNTHRLGEFFYSLIDGERVVITERVTVSYPVCSVLFCCFGKFYQPFKFCSRSVFCIDTNSLCSVCPRCINRLTHLFYYVLPAKFAHEFALYHLFGGGYTQINVFQFRHQSKSFFYISLYCSQPPAEANAFQSSYLG